MDIELVIFRGNVLWTLLLGNKPTTLVEINTLYSVVISFHITKASYKLWNFGLGNIRKSIFL